VTTVVTVKDRIPTRPPLTVTTVVTVNPKKGVSTVTTVGTLLIYQEGCRLHNEPQPEKPP